MIFGLLLLACPHKELRIVSEMKNKYDNRHGGPYDRGSADSYYRRGRNPHYFIGDTYKTPAITKLTEKELEAYNAGYDDNELEMNWKY